MEWIKLPGLLPEGKNKWKESDYVLAYRPRFSDMVVVWYNAIQNTWYIANHESNKKPIDAEEITHWMPLPEPPKE